MMTKGGDRSDVSLMEDSRDTAPPEVAASTATSRPAVAAWELADARRVLREWSLARFLGTRPATVEPIVFNADTPIGEALRVRAPARVLRSSFALTRCAQHQPKRMAEAGILSAPVLDAVDGQAATDFLGFIDVSDVVTSLLKGARRTRHVRHHVLAESRLDAQSCIRGCWTSRTAPLRAA